MTSQPSQELVTSSRLPENDLAGFSFEDKLRICKERTSVQFEDCLQLLQSCQRDADYFLVLGLLPGFLKSRQLTETESCLLLEGLPLELFARMLSSDDELANEDYAELVINVLSVLLPRCSQEMFHKLHCLAPPIKRRLHLIRSKSLTVKDVETYLYLVLIICEDSLSERDILSVLDVISSTLVSRTSELPSTDLLDGCIIMLRKLAELNRSWDEETPPWLKNYLLIVERILRTKYTNDVRWKQCFEICALICLIFGLNCFGNSSHFLITLTALTEVELRLILNEPKRVDVGRLKPCSILMRHFIQSVESSVLSDEDDATKVSLMCRDVTNFVCEYIVESEKSSDDELEWDVKIALYEIICSFFAVGGYNIIDRNVLHNVIPHLIGISLQSCQKGNSEEALQLIRLFGSLPELNDQCLPLMLHYLKGDPHSTTDYETRLEETKLVLSSLRGRADWYSYDDLKNVKNEAEAEGNESLLKILNTLDA